MRTALITGFGPFPGVPRNPSEVLARRIAALRIWNRLGWHLRVHALTTGYGTVTEAIDKEAAHKPAPAFVVMLGVAARAKWLRIELRAKNRVSSIHRDATSARPAATLLEPGAETVRFGRHMGAPLVRTLRAAHVPARFSRDCGRYVCNAAYWRMLGAMPRKTEVVFVHIPLPSKAGARKHDRRPGMAAMEHGLISLLRMMIGQARLRP